MKTRTMGAEPHLGQHTDLGDLRLKCIYIVVVIDFFRCVPVFAGNTHIAGLAMLRNSIKNSSALSAAATVHDVRDMRIFSRHLHPIHQEKTSMMSRVQQLQHLAIQFEKPRGEHIDRS